MIFRMVPKVFLDAIHQCLSFEITMLLCTRSLIMILDSRVTNKKQTSTCTMLEIPSRVVHTKNRLLRLTPNFLRIVEGPSLFSRIHALEMFSFPGIIRRVFYSCTLCNVICFCLCYAENASLHLVLCTQHVH